MDTKTGWMVVGVCLVLLLVDNILTERGTLFDITYERGGRVGRVRDGKSGERERGGGGR